MALRGIALPALGNPVLAFDDSEEEPANKRLVPHGLPPNEQLSDEQQTDGPYMYEPLVWKPSKRLRMALWGIGAGTGLLLGYTCRCTFLHHGCIHIRTRHAQTTFFF